MGRRKPIKKKVVKSRLPMLRYNNNRTARKKNPASDFPCKEISYQNLPMLFSFVTARGRILPKRVTRLSSKNQRLVAKSVKTARCVGLMPYINV